MATTSARTSTCLINIFLALLFFFFSSTSPPLYLSTYISHNFLLCSQSTSPLQLSTYISHLPPLFTFHLTTSTLQHFNTPTYIVTQTLYGRAEEDADALRGGRPGTILPLHFHSQDSRCPRSPRTALPLIALPSARTSPIPPGFWGCLSQHTYI
ncbi:hypothetical protein EJ06DRAFT_158669 [Trichodelitschia bisporula]|uniref:Uncharacterized protein n=1 Tax=Trichodelitschia bisporula TaxID=703511 RepID=A0A6G1HMI5_9PEZI|nr:hypothetical protein EJ06DRAFT_158669 [Trichodelitschia bisporula]